MLTISCWVGLVTGINVFLSSRLPQYTKTHLVLKPSEELEVERLEAMAIGGDEIQAAVNPAVNLAQRWCIWKDISLVAT